MADPFRSKKECALLRLCIHDADTGDYFILGHATFSFVLRSKALERDKRLKLAPNSWRV